MSNNPSEPQYRRMKVAAALAREQVLDLHVRHALELVDQSRRVLSPPRALRIYARLHRLREADAEAVRRRALAADARARHPEDAAAGPGADAWDSHSVVSRIRKRIRGRVHLDLRRWMEHHTARVEVSLLEVHVSHATHFIDLLRSSVSYGRAVELYCDNVSIPPAWRELLYFLAVARLDEPPLAAPAGEAVSRRARRAPAAASARLRLAGM